MHIAIQRDIGAHLLAVPAASGQLSGTTASTANGTAFNRLTGSNDLFLSCKVCIHVETDVALTTAATVQWNMQHAITSTGPWADFADRDGTTGTTVTMTTASANVVSVGDFELSSARQFIRIQLALNKATTVAVDFLTVAGAIVLGGGDGNPAD